MRLAIISDIHGNLEALESVLMCLKDEGVEAVLNLGDLVGYNASPNECLDLLQDQSWWHLAGNHDLALFDQERASYFNLLAYQALVWSRENLRPEHLEFLRNLPLTLEQETFIGCHGTPSSPDAYVAYHFQGKRVLSDLRRQAARRVCFFGHTHKRALWYRDVRGKVALQDILPQKIRLARDCHYLINPGSVGQPRDRNPQAAYAVFDGKEFSIHFKSTPYNVARAQQRILAAGLPPYLAERLGLGI